MSQRRRRLLVAGDDRSRTGQFVEWAPERYDVETALDPDDVPAAAAGVDVLFLAGRLGGRPMDLVVRSVRTAGADCRIVAVFDEDRSAAGADRTPAAADELLAPPVDRPAFERCLDRIETRLVYDDRFEEFYEVATERGRLEASRSPDELAGDEEYRRLRSRTATLREQLDDLLPEGEGEPYEAMFRDLFPGTPR